MHQNKLWLFLKCLCCLFVCVCVCVFIKLRKRILVHLFCISYFVEKCEEKKTYIRECHNRHDKDCFENTEITIKNKDCFEKQIKVYKYCWTIYLVFPKDDQMKAWKHISLKPVHVCMSWSRRRSELAYFCYMFAGMFRLINCCLGKQLM